MATVIDSPVIRELTAILEGIDRFPNPNESDFKTCRALSKNASTIRCRMRFKDKTEDEVKGLRSLFQSTTKFVDTNDLYHKMESFISLTHCKRHHRGKALEAFNRWKIEREAAISTPRPATPSSNAAYNAYCESVSDASSIGSPSFASDGLEYDESTLDTTLDTTLDSDIAEKIQGLNVSTAAKDTSATTVEIEFGEIETEREKLMKISNDSLPTKAERHDQEKASESSASLTTSESAIPRIFESFDITGFDGKGGMPFIETEVTEEIYGRRRVEKRPDGNYEIVSEIKRIVRKKVSHMDIKDGDSEADGYLEPAVSDPKGKEQKATLNPKAWIKNKWAQFSGSEKS